MKLFSTPRRLHLIYRGITNGFNYTNFQWLANNTNETLTIVKTTDKTDGKVFGGYTNIAWDNNVTNN